MIHNERLLEFKINKIEEFATKTTYEENPAKSNVNLFTVINSLLYRISKTQ